MSKALSVDLRIRVLAAVAKGLTHRQAREWFGVSAAFKAQVEKAMQAATETKPADNALRSA